MATLGRAFIEIRADSSEFPKDVREAVRRLDDDIRQATERSGARVGRRLSSNIRNNIGSEFRGRPLRLVAELDVSRVSLARTEAAVAAATRDRTINIWFNRRAIGNFLRETGRLIGLFALAVTRILADLFDFGRQISQIFGEAFRNINQALGNAASATVTLGAAFVQLAAAAAALAAVIVLLVGVIGTLLALLVVLVETTQLLLVILPGLGGALLLSLGPLVLIFSNLGDAIKATRLEAEEFEEFIEDFGPNTRGALTALRDLVQFFLELREGLQEDFFGPINDAIEDLDANLGPAFRLGFENVATAAGRFAAAFIELFEHPQAPTFFLSLFRLGAVGFQEIGGAIINLIAAFANLADETLPEVEDAIQGIADIINGWADDINQLAEDEDFQDTLDDWKESFDTLNELLGEIVDLAGNLIDGFRDDGIPVVETLTEILEGINEFLESDAGEEFFDGMRVAAELFLLTVNGTLLVIGSIILLLGIIDEILTEDIDGGFQLLQESFGPILGLFNVWIELLQEANSIWEVILAIVAGVPMVLIRIIARIAEAVGQSSTFQFILRQIRNFVRGIRDAIRDFVDRLRRATSNALNVSSAFSGIAGWARSIRDFLAGALQNIQNIIAVAGGFGSGLLGALLGGRFGAEGGIFTGPTRLTVGEAGPEVLIPLTRPQRARELYQESGLANLIQGGDGASVSSPSGMVGQSRTIIEIRSDGTPLGEMLLEILQRAIRVRGGDVQVVLGS